MSNNLKSALLVIDCIEGIAHGSCKDYVAQYPVIQNIQKLILHCRENNIPIYFVRLAFDAQYTDIPKHSPMFSYVKQKGLFQLGSPSSDFIPELAIQPRDTIINKTAVNPFHSKDLEKSLQANHIEKLIFCGLATDNAINLGTREAHDKGYYTVVVEDACGAGTREFHQWSIELLKKIANEIVSVDP